MNATLVVFIGVAFLLGLTSVLLFNDPVRHSLKTFLLPIVVSAATATMTGNEDPTPGILSGAYLTLVLFRAIDDGDDLEIPVIGITIMLIIGTFAVPGTLAQITAAAYLLFELSVDKESKLRKGVADAVFGDKNNKWNFVELKGLIE